MKRYILWLNYGSYEGWRPEQFDTVVEIYAYIQGGNTNGQPFEITERLEFFRGEACV